VESRRHFCIYRFHVQLLTSITHFLQFLRVMQQTDASAGCLLGLPVGVARKIMALPAPQVLAAVLLPHPSALSDQFNRRK
jgi:hypothetical protein